MAELTRRLLLKLTGVGGASALAAGLGVKNAQRLIPLMIPPTEPFRPGQWMHYATTCRECPAGCGMHVRCIDGRAQKCEGNPAHEINHGALCPRGQSAVQGLYDPDRLKHAYHRVNGVATPVDLPTAIQEIAKLLVAGKPRKLCVHRKGATRAHVPRGSRSAWRYGQPVIVPGDMGSRSYLCVGTEKSLTETWGSSCHGAGRILSRTAAKKRFGGRDLIGELKAEGITVMAEGRGTMAEEMRGAYKDVSQVVGIMEGAGISLRVARLRPIGVIKG